MRYEPKSKSWDVLVTPLGSDEEFLVVVNAFTSREARKVAQLVAVEEYGFTYVRYEDTWATPTYA